MGRRSGQTERETLLAMPRYVHERDGQIYVRIWYRNAAGKWKDKSRRVDTVAEAVRAIDEIQREIGLRGPSAFDGEKMTFDQLMDEYLKVRPMRDWYSTPLKDHFGKTRIRSIDFLALQAFKKAREAVKKSIPDPTDRKKKIQVDRKPATIHREMEALRTVLLFAFDNEWIVKNPFKQRHGQPSLIRKSEEERRSDVPTREQEAAILAACVPPREHLRALLIATRDTGLRKSALFELTWSMVDWAGRLLLVPRGGPYKGRPDCVGLTRAFQEELAKLREKEKDPAPDGKIFTCGQEIKRSYKTACRLAGVKGLRFNDWRHLFSTNLMEAEVNKRLAMKAAGHKNVDIHDIYEHLTPPHARQIAEALDRLYCARQPTAFGAGEAIESNVWIN